MCTQKLTFDNIFLKICTQIPFIGQYLVKWYTTIGWFNRFLKFGITTLVIYWLSAPFVLFVTDFLHMHYLLSAFIVGVTLALLRFVISEGWIWKKREGKKST